MVRPGAQISRIKAAQLTLVEQMLTGDPHIADLFSAGRVYQC